VETITAYNAQGWTYPRLVNASHKQFWDHIEEQISQQSLQLPLFRGDYGTAWEAWVEVAVSVSDDGAGIDAALLPMIFEPFVQDDRSLDRAKGGLGVGLSIVRSIVELHGGRVAARSDGRDRGAEFVVHLPVTALPAGTDAAAANGAPTASDEVLHKLRVLVVEDNGDSADAMRTLVDEWGHEAFAVGNGPAALEHWVGWRADVVLLDIGLPGMSGHQVARRLRELAAGAPLLLVAITGYGSAGDRQASSDSGFDLHLCKPVDLDHLESVLGAHATALHAARAG
jgi:CheY-like chemotaxis protein